MPSEPTFILLFVVATAVAIVVRRMQMPYTVALVLAGLILGALPFFQPPSLTRSLLFSVFLPGLIFEAAFHIDFNALWRNRYTIVSLALPGVVASMALVSLILTPVAKALGIAEGFSWHHALVFGALISATDPIAVIALFRSLGAPRRLTMLLDGESLLNDGTGIVFFTLSVSLVTGASVTPGQLTVEFFSIIGLGMVIGLAIGLVASLVIRQVDDAMIEITLTTIAAYGSFVAAEELHYSGVIATVVCGLICGNFGARTGMTPSTRVSVENFWEYVAFALNSIVFLLIGLEARPAVLFSYWPAIIVAYLVVMVGRSIVILTGWSVLRMTRERFSARWGFILTWGGLRGALPMVLVLSLGSSFPFRELLVAMTFGVVLLSILLQGMTMAPLLRWLGIVQGREERTAFEVGRGKSLAAAAALEEIERMSHGHDIASRGYGRLQGEYEQRLDKAKNDMRELGLDPAELRGEELIRVRRHLIHAERERVMEAFREGTIGTRAQERLLADIDARLLRLDTEGGAEEEAREGEEEEEEELKN